MRPFLDSFRDHALDTMSAGLPAGPLIRHFLDELQASLPDVVIGLTILDAPGRTFRHALFPTLPDSFGKSLENTIITGKRGSCGMGIVTGKTVIVPNVATDSRFSQEWKDLFFKHGLEAVVSFPALGKDGTPQGSIAVIHRLDQTLNSSQMALVETASQMFSRLCAYCRTRESESVLFGEMEHRMNNLFTVVGGVAHLTMKNHPAPKAFREVFSNRLMVLHDAYSTTKGFAREIELALLFDEVLAPHRDSFSIKYEGARIVLSPNAASALALVIHELGINSVKYGALSQPGGALDIGWHVDPANDADADVQFRLTWRERNGPPVHPPTRKGYGTAMISTSLRNAFEGRSIVSYDASGLVCTIDAPFTDRLGRFDQPDTARGG